MSTPEPATIKVWDPLVRLSHWTLVASFAIAYVTEGEGFVLLLHVWAGYLVGAIVALRTVWGVIGSKHARFTDFVFHPRTSWNYLKDMLRFRSKRYLGHSPAGGAMVIVLLVGLAATVWSGIKAYAPVKTGAEGDLWSSLHETVAGLVLTLIVVHILGVIFASIAHRENLARSMITGRKPLR